MKSRRSNLPTPLAIARISAGLSQSDLGEVIGRSNIFVHRLENNGCARLTPEMVEKIAEAVGTPSFIIFAGMRAKPR